MKKQRMKEIASTALVNLIELDFQNGIETFDCNTIDEYCNKILNASQDEIEEILGMCMEEMKIVEIWLRKQEK